MSHEKARFPKLALTLYLFLALLLLGNLFLFCACTAGLWMSISDLLGWEKAGLCLALFSYLGFSVLLPCLFAWKLKKKEDAQSSFRPIPWIWGSALLLAVLWGLLFWFIPREMRTTWVLNSDWLFAQTLGPESAVTQKLQNMAGKGTMKLADKLRLERQISPGNPEFALVCKLKSAGKFPPFDSPGDLTVQVRALSPAAGQTCKVTIGGQSQEQTLGEGQPQFEFQFPKPENGWGSHWKTVLVEGKDPDSQSTVEEELEFERLHDELRNVSWREVGSLGPTVEAFAVDSKNYAFLRAGQLSMYSSEGERLWTLVGLPKVKRGYKLISSDGSDSLALSLKNQLVILSKEKGELIKRLSLPSEESSLMAWNDKWLLYEQGKESTETLCLNAEGSLLWVYQGHPSPVEQGGHLFLLSQPEDDTSVLVFAEDGTPLWGREFKDSEFSAAGSSKEADCFLGLQDGEQPQVWELDKNQRLPVAAKPSHKIDHSIVTDKFWILQSDEHLYCYNLADWEMTETELNTQGEMLQVTDNELVILGKRSVSVHTLPSLERVRGFNCGPTEGSSLSEDSRWFALPKKEPDSAIQIYDVQSSQLSKTIPSEGDAVFFEGTTLFVREGRGMRPFLVPR